MKERRLNPGKTALILLMILMTGSPAAHDSFSYVGQGEALPEMTLPRQNGGQASYLGDDTHRARVSAFVARTETGA